MAGEQATFIIDSYFNKDAQFKRVTFGSDGKLTEAELNELQDIQNHRLARLMTLTFGSRPIYVGTYAVSGGKLIITNEYVSIDGEIVFIPTTNFTVAIGDAVYLNKIESTLTYADAVRKYGDLASSTTVPNNMLDTRIGQETTRRVQVTYQLTKTAVGTGTFQKLCDIINNGSGQPAVQQITYSDSAVIAEARKVTIKEISDRIVDGAYVATTSKHGLMSSTDKTKLDGVAQNANNYTHPANHPPSIITQDASNRFTTDAEKATWNAKASTSVATTGANGLMSSTDKTKLDGVAQNANNYTHPANHPASIITQDLNNRFVTDAEKATWNAKASTATATPLADGLMSSTDKGKLDGVATGANNYTHPANHPASIITQDLNNRFVTDAEKATWNAKETPAGAQGKVDTHAGDTTAHITGAERTTWNAKASTAVATTVANGLMSSTDKSKLDGVATGANNYTHPANHPASIITQDLNNRFVTDAEKATWNAKETPTGAQGKVDTHAGDAVKHITASERVNWNAKASTAVATTGADGLMSSTDKTKLNGVAQNANNYTHPANHPPSIITQDASNRFVTDTEKSTWNTHAGDKNNPHEVTKYQVGLGNVPDFVVASQIEAEAGSSDARFMTPIKTKQAITALQSVKSVAGRTGDVTIAKGDVGLDNVDNVKQASKAEFDSYVVNASSSSQSQLEEVSKLRSKNDNLVREVAHLKLKQQASDRIEGGSTFADNFAGTSFGMTLDTKKAKSTVALTAGTTVLHGKVDNASGFSVGQSVTVLDDVTKEVVTITRSEMVLDVQTSTRTDVSVVNNAYDTSGNGGRKVTKLTNGWLVASAYDGSAPRVVLYVSKDEGATWTQLCYLAYTSYGHSIISSGNVVHVLLAVSTGWRCFSFDATVITNVDINANRANVLTVGGTDGETTTNGASIAINGAKNELHCAWASKLPSYPNSFNIRYVKGTIASNGSVTWGSVVQVTPNNTATQDNKNPSVIVNGSNVPIIFYDYNYGTALNTLKSRRWNGTDFSEIVVKDNNGYVQSGPSALFVPQSVNGLANGRIWVAWSGLSAGDTAYYNVHLSYSDDGGTTWSAMQKLTDGVSQHYTQPSVTADKNNNLYVVFSGEQTSADYYDIKMLKFSSGAWGAIQTIKNATTNHLNYPQTLVDLTLDCSIPLFIYNDAVSAKVGFYGTWTAEALSQKLECSPLANSYKKGAWVARSTINADGTFPKWDATGIITRTDVTIVGNSYDVAGNGARKLIRLNNGNMYCAVYDTTVPAVKLYKSVDGGATWTFFKSWGNSLLSGFALETNGTDIYYVRAYGNSYLGMIWVKEDGTEVAGPNIDSGQNTMGNMSVAINEAKTELHCAWSSKNASYSNSHNIRYAKGTIAGDGSVTWGSVVQVSTDNNTGVQHLNPSIIVKADGRPVIINERDQTNNAWWSIEAWVHNGTNFGGTGAYVTAYSPGNYQQHTPSAIFVPKSVNGLTNGRIWVTWSGRDATNTTYYNIKVTYSDDGGATWTGYQNLTPNGTIYNELAPSITANKNNEIFILWYGLNSYSGGLNQIKQIKNTAGTWGAITDVTASGANRIDPSTLYDTSLDFNSPIFMYRNSSNLKVGLYGTWNGLVDVPLLEAIATYNLDRQTDDIGLWVQYEGEGTIKGSSSFGSEVIPMVDEPIQGSFTVTITEV